MSWRDQSTFTPSSALCDDEKEFLKVAKKLRDIAKLEAKVSEGENLAENQKTKINSKPDLIKQLAQHAKLMPTRSEVWEKNQDVAQYLPKDMVRSVEKTREANVRRLEKEEAKKDEPRAMQRHDRAITSICYDSTHGYVYTASKDKYVLEWKVDYHMKRLRAVRTLAGHEGSVWCLDLSEEGVICGAADGRLCVFARSSGAQDSGISKPVRSATVGGVVKALHYQPTGIAVAGDKVGSSPAYVAVVDHRLREVWRQTDFPAKINAVVWGPEGAVTKVVSAHEDGRMAVWNGSNGERMVVIMPHQGPIWSLSRCGDFVVSASQDKTAKVTDFSSRELPEVRKVEANRPLRTCIYDGFDSIVYAGGREPRDVTTSNLLADEFEIFCESEGKTMKTQGAHFGPVHQVCFSSSGSGPQSFFSISEDGCLKFWSASGVLLADDSL
eukprot:GEMP01029705.1.p1 GENE.GEMP01029705.1~~GEMP01029705.1.p1  ORF type:complete len:440 (+),score=97.35 GEMP01029705.1:438-1757(+)